MHRGPIGRSPKHTHSRHLPTGSQDSSKALSSGGQAPHPESSLAVQRVWAAAPKACAFVPRAQLLRDGSFAERAARGTVLQRRRPHYAAVRRHQPLVAQGRALLGVRRAQAGVAQLPLARRQVALRHHHEPPSREVPGGQQQLGVVGDQLSATGRGPGPVVARWLGEQRGRKKEMSGLLLPGEVGWEMLETSEPLSSEQEWQAG